MIDSRDPLGRALLLESWRGSARDRLADLASPAYLGSFNNGNLPGWLDTLAAMPELSADRVDLLHGVSLLQHQPPEAELLASLRQGLEVFIPWRKGPFNLFGVDIDSEWRCNLKWDRLRPHLDPLAGRQVLDVGSGNGYYCLRALGAGAALVVGLEPHLPYLMQFIAIRQYISSRQAFVLPVRLEDFDGPRTSFDTALSMGVIYHVKSPVEHLSHLGRALRPGGQLVLETLVVDGPDGYCLTPAERYARMSNVWFVPSLPTLERWMLRCGYTDIQVVDISTTTTEEQRRTAWMPYDSLADALDPLDPLLTLEGLPAPRRAIVTARTRG